MWNENFEWMVNGSKSNEFNSFQWTQSESEKTVLKSWAIDGESNFRYFVLRTLFVWFIRISLVYIYFFLMHSFQCLDFKIIWGVSFFFYASFFFENIQSNGFFVVSFMCPCCVVCWMLCVCVDDSFFFFRSSSSSLPSQCAIAHG